MDEKQRKQKELQLNEAARRWAANRSESLASEVWLLAYDLYYNARGIHSTIFGLTEEQMKDVVADSFTQTIEYVLKAYNPQEGEFSHLFSYKRKQVIRDIKDKFIKAGYLVPESLDETIGSEEDSPTKGDQTVDKDVIVESSEETRISQLFDELSALIVNLALRLGNRAGNATAQRWMRIFLTEDMTNAAKTLPFSLAHEAETFEAMQTDFLDYYMSAICRTVAAITTTPLKPMGQVLVTCPPDKVNTILPVPFGAEVSLSYLRTAFPDAKGANNASRSEYYAKYKTLRQELFSGIS